jgi:hypothetical protein
MIKKSNVYRLLVGKPDGRSPLGRTRSRWVDNNKMKFVEMCWCGLNWICLTQDRYKWRAIVNAVMNLQFPWKCWETIEWLQKFCVSLSSTESFGWFVCWLIGWLFGYALMSGSQNRLGASCVFITPAVTFACLRDLCRFECPVARAGSWRSEAGNWRLLRVKWQTWTDIAYQVISFTYRRDLVTQELCD